MPRLKKNGSRPVSKSVAEAQANVHRSVVSEIKAVIARAVSALPDQADYPAGRDRLGRLASDMITHYASLLKLLRDLSDEHEDLALQWTSVVKVGRPKSSSGLLWQGLKKISQQPKMVGRPAVLNPGHFRSVYLKVEQRRNELRQASKTATIKAALESLFEDRARAKNIPYSQIVDESYTRYRASYGRGKKLVLSA